MNKYTQTLLFSVIAIGINSAYAQNVRIGNTTSGMTASGNTISIANGNGAIQLNNIPAIVQGVMNSAKEMNVGEANNKVETGNKAETNSDVEGKNKDDMSKESLSKLEAAKNNFIKQKEDTEKLASTIQLQTQTKQIKQEPVRVGQDLKTIKSNMVTDNIGFYNNSTINEFEEKSGKENSEMYSKFPEYIIKNY